ncbi:MAG: glucosyl-3-phosphoglycerate synthase [Actinomycetota bacterium]
MVPGPTDWFERRTFHHSDFADADALVRAKLEQGLAVSVCVPALNEESTVGVILESIRTELMEKVPLIDELALIDSASSDRTAEIARAAGADVYQDREILPDIEPFAGKGEALWKSLFVLKGDVILWLDADITNFHPRFVLGPLGPILTDPGVGYVKSFYRRPMGDAAAGAGKTLEGGRVTELAARPLISMFWPHLAGLIQPLAGEYAGRRELLEQVPFCTGYGVEIGLLIDIAERFGLDAMAQVDLEERTHRNRPIGELSRMAFAVIHAGLSRLARSGRLEERLDATEGLYQFEPANGSYEMRATDIEVRERPPAVEVEGYPPYR